MFDLSALSPAQVRALLPSWLAGTVSAAVSDEVREAVTALVDQANDAELAAALDALARVGSACCPWPADPFARRLSRTYMGRLLAPGSRVEGVDHLRAAVQAGPTLLLGNHRAYVDTQLTDLLLAQVDPGLADRLVTVAGPKVYEDPLRRVASAGLHTIKTAQSTAVASEQAVLSVREVARIAAETVRQAQTLMQQGHAVLLYPEGTRSRDGQLGPFLRGAGRYASLPGTHIVPALLTGSEQVMPVGSATLSPAVVHLRLLPAFAAEGLDRDRILERARRELSGPG